MAKDTERIKNWWGTLNRMSKAELYFQQTLDARNHISTKRGRAILLSRESPTELSGTALCDWRFQVEKAQICLMPDEFVHTFENSDGIDQIVLEDISREWVEAIGPWFNILISVFALHWANPIDHVNGEAQLPVGESPSRHFILNYRQLLPFSIQNRANETIVNGVKKGQLKE